MFHYLFTNDLRISNLESFLIEAARCFKNDCVPSASEDKNANNNMNTLGFYFNLTKTSNCAVACANGNVRKVVLNFIKKFQFPNPRTSTSLTDCINDGIQLAPMRVILQVLYLMQMICPDEAFLTKKEIADYIFFNDAVAKTAVPNISDLVNAIVSHRDGVDASSIPDDDILESKGCYWKQCKRQVREMVKVLCWSGCVIEDDNGCIKIHHDNLSRDNKADLFEIITFKGKWSPDASKNAEGNRESYQAYMDISLEDESGDFDMIENIVDYNEQKERFRLWMTKQKKANGEPYSSHTIYSYINQMINGYDSFEKYNGYESVFQIQDPDSLNEYTDYLFNAEGFDEFNEKAGNKACSCGLIKYCEFLKDKPIKIENREKGGINRIYYGAPGCGKSRLVSDIIKGAGAKKENVIRVTFHPEYANCDFIGQILPTVETTENSDGTSKEIVKYIFNPGPLTLALKTAYNTSEMVYLIIEEINRGNAAAIFGDMFQLLDRVRDAEDENYSASEYPVCNPNMQKWLVEEALDDSIKEMLNEGVFVPSNLTIYATMNSSDQNVFTLDTAFKRRWSFEQISNDIERDNDHKYKKWYVPGTSVTWEKFLTKLNSQILENKIHNQTNEDKRLGKYFVTRDCLTENIENIADVQENASAFAYKVLEYVWNDVCKIGREDWFEVEKYRTLEDLIAAFLHPADGYNPLSVFQNISF